MTSAIHSASTVQSAELAIRRAQLASDVAALDTLLDDALVFTGPDGAIYAKRDDLDVHRSGVIKTTQLEPSVGVSLGDRSAARGIARHDGAQVQPGCDGNERHVECRATESVANEADVQRLVGAGDAFIRRS